MQKVNVNLINQKAEIINFDTIYIEGNDDIEVTIVNELDVGEKLYFKQAGNKSGVLQPVTGQQFIINSINLTPVTITLIRTTVNVPENFILDFAAKQITIINPLDKKYPDTIAELYNSYVQLAALVKKNAEEIEKLKKVGVIE